MPSPRTFTLRHLWFLLGGLLSLLLVAVGLVWVVFHHPAWIESLPDTDTFVVRRAVERLHAIRLRWPAVDSDGDGVVDWWEVAHETDPHDATKFPYRGVECQSVFAFRDERTRLRLQLNLGSGPGLLHVPWPIGTEADITAAGSILIPAGKPEAAPTAGPLRVKPSPDGYLEFDVLCRQQRDADWIAAHNSVGGVQLSHPGIPLIACIGWRLPARPARAEMRVPDVNRVSWGFPSSSNGLFWEVFGPPPPMLHLDWEPLPGRVFHLLEAARADAPDRWVGFHLANPNWPPWHLIGGVAEQIFPGYRGPVLYRATPVSDEPPGDVPR